MRSVVSLRQIRDYEPQAVVQAMRASLEPLGGMGAFVRAGQTVLLKPNLLGGYAPSRAVTTHPSVVRAAILLVRAAGGRAIVGDGPGVGALASVARICGITAILAETGAQLGDFGAAVDFEAPQGVVAKRLRLAKTVADADVIITLPKLKTHGQMTFTGALKNQFGLIPGKLKAQWHFRLQRPEWLAELILDIHQVARPTLAIMDAVVGMEGQGPSGGRPRELGCLLAGRDLAAVDTLACHLIGLEPSAVPTLAAARRRGLGATSMAELDVKGDDWERLRQAGFQKVSKVDDLLRLVPLPMGVLRWIRERWTLRPTMVAGACTGCGICVGGCPVSPSAIHPADGQVDDLTCIRCYCCHELCPNQAILLEHPPLFRPLRFSTRPPAPTVRP